MSNANEGRDPSKSVAVVELGVNSERAAWAPHLLSKHQLALTLGVSPRTIDNFKAQRKIPFLRLSSRLVRFNLERVKEALGRYEVREVGRAR